VDVESRLISKGTAVAAVLGAVGLAIVGPAGTAQAGGGGFTIALSSSAYSLWTGQSATITATVNADVGPTPYFISVYDETAGQELAVCGAGTTCSATVTQNVPAAHTFEAYVGDYPPSDAPPGFVVVASPTVQVGWNWIIAPILRG
jgi:hypothetical protein